MHAGCLCLVGGHERAEQPVRISSAKEVASSPGRRENDQSGEEGSFIAALSKPRRSSDDVMRIEPET